MKRLIRFVRKSILWGIGGIIALIALALLLIQVPYVQKVIKNKAVHFLESKIKTKVEIRNLSFDFPKILVLEGVYFEDEHQDTLLIGDTLIVDISLFKLLRNEVEINLIDLRGITAFVNKTFPDSTYNFDYIIRAFIKEEGKAAPPIDSAASMRFSVERINLERIHVKYADEVSGTQVISHLMHFDSRIRDFDLDEMKFDIPKISVSGLDVVLRQTKALSAETLSADTSDIASAFAFQELKLGVVDLSRINIDYVNTVSAIDAKADLGHLLLEFDDLDMQRQAMQITNLVIDDFSGNFALGKSAQQAVEAKAIEVKTIAEKGWTVQLAKLGIKNTNFTFEDLTIERQKIGLDYNHINLTSINGTGSAIFYSADTISGKVEQLSLSESSGLEIRKFNADFFYTNQKAYLKNLFLETPGSIITDRVELTYPSIETLNKNIGDIGLDANLIHSKISIQDILIFVPTLATNTFFKRNPNGEIMINGSINGKVNNLVIPGLEVYGPGKLLVNASGIIKGLPNVDDAYFDLRINNLTASKSDITAFIPAGTIPAEIQLPDHVQLKGVFKGRMNDFSSTLNLYSDLGNAFIDGTIRNATVSGREEYDVKLVTDNFNIGKLISQDELVGDVSLDLTLDGKGTDPKTSNIKFDGKIRSLQYSGYTYKNLAMHGTSLNGMIEAAATIKDPNIAIELAVKVEMSEVYPKLNMVLQMDRINLQQLGFYKDDLRFQGTIIADLETADPDYLNGHISLSKSIFNISGKQYRLDTISIVSVATAGEDSLQIKSEFLIADMHGDYKLTQVPAAVWDNINTYFKLTSAGDTTSVYDPQNFAFNARLTHSPLIAQLLPDLHELSDVELNGTFDSKDGSLFLDGGVARIQYLDYNVIDLKLGINTENDALNYIASFDQLSSGQIQMLNTSLSGKAQNNLLEGILLVKDINNIDQYRIAGNLKTTNHLTEFSLVPDGLILDRRPWIVSSDNALYFGTGGMMAHNFALSNNSQQIILHSTPQNLDAPLSILFNDFNIETLTRLVMQDSLVLGGVINGEAQVLHLLNHPVFTSELRIKNFAFRGDTLGNIDLSVNNTTKNTYAAKMSLTDRGNDVNLDGYYIDSGERSHFDFDLNIGHLNLKTIEGFSFGQVEESSGSLSGDLKLSGTLSAPQIRGDLNFKDAGFKITQFNSFYKLKDEKIGFAEEGIVLKDFTLTDHDDNDAIFDGVVYTKDFRDYQFGLTVHTEDFQILNSTREDNDLYFGQLVVDARMRIAGTTDHPIVDGSIKIKDKTILTIVVPQADMGIVEREGIVEFIDLDDTLYGEELAVARSSLSQSDLRGMDISVNISIDRKAELDLVIDEANGDYLSVKGGGELTGGIDQSGKISLTGNYQLEEGVYNLTFNFIKREFLIRKGSTITWTGEPMTASVDVTAVYIAETAPLDLVKNQLGEISPSILNTYKQKLPFEILLTMKGELLKPEITFDIDLPKKNYGVSGDIISTVDVKLAQLRAEPSELNKQVFAVLLLNRFISDNPFQNAAGGGSITSLAKQSASKLLSEQLNNIVGGMISGFDLNFDLNSTEDYSSGELKNRTNLTVGVSKQLLSDRLKVTIGSNFELDGAQETSRKATSIAGNVSAEYQLTKDGRYVFRAYRKDEYIVVQGQVVETGVGFVITADYDRFKDIFARNTNDVKETRKEQRKERQLEGNK